MQSNGRQTRNHNNNKGIMCSGKTHGKQDSQVVQLFDVFDESLSSPVDQIVLTDELLLPPIVQRDLQVSILSDPTREVVDRQVQTDFCRR